MTTGFLRVSGTHIVDEDDGIIRLRGSSLGGCLNMENFVNGYLGSESNARAVMLKVMGPENYNFFFDRFIYHFFTEEDARLNGVIAR